MSYTTTLPKDYTIPQTRVTKLITREAVLEAERQMREFGKPVDIPVKHHFSDGIYAREITIPADTMLTGKIHKKENLNFLLRGEISVLVDGKMVRMVGPAGPIVSPPGTKRIAYTHTEVVWVTVHGTHETDLAKIEAEFIAQDEAEWLAYAAAKKLEVKP